MDPVEYLRTLKRRWPIIAAAVAIAAAVGGATATVVAPVGSSGSTDTSYDATALLFNTNASSATTGLISLPSQDISTLAKTGEVPIRVAERLDFEISPAELAGSVEVIRPEGSGLLQITATSTKANRAEALANAFASELPAWLSEREKTFKLGAAKALAKNLESLQREIVAVEGQVAAARGDPLLVAQRDALVAHRLTLAEQYQQLRISAALPAGYQVVQQASATPSVTTTDTTFQPPDSRPERTLLAALLGLAFGIGIALIVDRLDTRIHTRDDAEEHFARPVLAEIPEISRRERKRFAIPASRARSRAADAFRLLATAMARPSADGAGNGHSPELLAPVAMDKLSSVSPDSPRPRAQPSRHAAGLESLDGLPRTILVTSAGPGEGKTTTVVNLAAVLAEMGRRVLVVSCDFQRPRLHDFLHVSNDTGLSDAIQSADGGPVLEGRVTTISLGDFSIDVVPSGPSPDKPGELLSSANMRRAIAEARQLADVVILDSAPLLSTSDAALLFGDVDSVLVVARAGHTRAAHAERAIELLTRLGARVPGVALNCSGDTASSKYRYYTGSSGRGRGFSRLVRHRSGV
ncbi:MAG: AAA family ATPase [Actinomycetota bacterium]